MASSSSSASHSKAATTASAATSSAPHIVEHLPTQPVCLIVIDGWGISPVPNDLGDAIKHAKTPVMTSLAAEFPHMALAAHGLAVGLPDGVMGNSETGHLNIGAGRTVYQDLVRIDLAVQRDTLHKQPAWIDAVEHCKQHTGRLHLLGLVSDGGVHSHINHLLVFLEKAKLAGIKETFVHFFGDGRDTNPRSSNKFLADLQKHIAKIKYGSISTIVGRYYAMDRDKRWDRVKVAYEAIVGAVGELSADPLKTIDERFKQNETDEFLKPIICNAMGIVKDGDTLIFFDYRSDRMREITQCFGVPPFPLDSKIPVPTHLKICTMTQYKQDFPFSNIFPPQSLDNVLAEWLGKNKIPQYHAAETEKYAHVTFFFNGGQEVQFALEERELVNSPKVATYDLKPEMSAKEVGDVVVAAIKKKKFPFVMCNFANPDMVGHTGIYAAAVKAVEATDAAIGAIFEACRENGYVLAVTADHGNAEKMIDEQGGPHTAHTCNPVPFIVASRKHRFITKFPADKVAALCDVAPTVLEIMGVPKPVEMDGMSLLERSDESHH